MKKLEDISMDGLKAAANALSAARYVGDDGLNKPFVEKALKVVAISKENLIKNFVSEVERIAADEKLAAQLPADVILFYNDNLADDAVSAEPAAAAPAEQAAPAAAAPAGAVEPETEGGEKKGKKAKAPKEPKPPKEKKPKKEVAKTEFGHIAGSQAGKLDELLSPGNWITMDDLVKGSGRAPLGVKSHIQHLKKDRGLTIEDKDGSYRLVRPAAAPAAPAA